MNHLRIALIATAAAGCSTPSPQPAAPPLKMEFYRQPYARQEPGPDLQMPRFCHVSLDCMELDSRPFAPCYTNGATCEGEGGFIQAVPATIFPTEDIASFPDSPPQK